MNRIIFNTKSCLSKKFSSICLKVLAVAVVASSAFVFETPKSEAAACTTSPCNTKFQVNVRETLAVQITSPTTGATGDINQFLRNKVGVNVTTNSTGGFTASMYSKDNTNLSHSSLSGTTIPTLASYSTRGSFPANRWGYSLSSGAYIGGSSTYNDTEAGNNSSRYYPLVSTSGSPLKILEASAGTTTGSQNIYFGAKADATKPSGTYANTVVISVVTGAVNSSTNPMTPTNPAKPTTSSTTGSTATSTGRVAYYSAPTGGSSAGTTVHTSYSDNSGTKTTTSEVSEGNNVNAYQPPHGVIEEIETNVASNSTLAATLATAATLAASSGMFFFIAAKRRGDDDDDEDMPQDVI